MPEPATYEIVIRGWASTRILRPLLDDFACERTEGGVTRLTGLIRDPSHLHGLVAHLTSLNAELISIARLGARRTAPLPTDLPPTSYHERTNS